jgi:hypothetical protein
MENLIFLKTEEMKIINGGGEEERIILTGYPGQSLVNLVWSTLKAAYQKGYDDKLANIEPCS